MSELAGRVVFERLLGYLVAARLSGKCPAGSYNAKGSVALARCRVRKMSDKSLGPRSSNVILATPAALSMRAMSEKSPEKH